MCVYMCVHFNGLKERSWRKYKLFSLSDWQLPPAIPHTRLRDEHQALAACEKYNELLEFFL